MVWGGGQLPAPVQALLDALSEAAKNPAGAVGSTVQGLEDVATFAATIPQHPLMFLRGFADETEAGMFDQEVENFREAIPDFMRFGERDPVTGRMIGGEATEQFNLDAFSGEGADRVKAGLSQWAGENPEAAESIMDFMSDERVQHAGKSLEAAILPMLRRPRTPKVNYANYINSKHLSERKHC